jgi:hypothetical protein
MLMEIAVETLWHDNGTKVIVPIGERVDTRDIKLVPKSERPGLSKSIDDHAKRGEDFVPIKIRHWWAIINRKWLRYPIPVTTPQAAKATKRSSERLLIPVE